MPVLARCHYRPGGADERLRIRAAHLQFMIAHRLEIEAGGALLGPEGEVSGMFLLLACDSIEDAESWFAPEPYTAAGLFASRTFEVARRFIPSEDPNLLETMLQEARSSIARGPRS